MADRTIHYSSVSLPPGVQGHEKGLLDIIFSKLILDASAELATPQVRIKWWGSEVDAEDVVELPRDPKAEALVRFVLHSRFQTHVQRYLNDMALLPLHIIENGSHIGTASLDVANITYPRPLAAKLPILNDAGVKVGSVDVKAVVHIPMHGTADTEEHHHHKTHNPIDHHHENHIPSTTAAAHHLHPAHQQPKPPPQSSNISASQFYTHQPPVVPRGANQIIVHIESATHLPDYSGDTDDEGVATPNGQTSPKSAKSKSDEEDEEFNGYSAFVSASWRSKRLRASTPAAVVVDVPPAGRCAIWNVHLAFPADISDVSTTVHDRTSLIKGKESLKDSSVHSDEEYSLNTSKALLLLNVWRSRSKHIGSRHNAPTEVHPLDTLIGCAAIDLSELTHEGGLIKGEFPVVDYLENVTGQIKLAISLSNALDHQIYGDSIKRSAAHSSEVSKSHHQHHGRATSVITAKVDNTPSPNSSTQNLTADKHHADHHHRPNDGDDPMAERWRAMNESLKKLELSLEQQPQTTQQINAAAANIRTAWSGSDSDDNDVWTGVAVDGAVSEEDIVHEDERDRQVKRKPTLELSDDWMFSIGTDNKTLDLPGDHHDIQKASHEDATEKTSQGGGDAAATTTAVKFKNKLPSAIESAGLSREMEMSLRDMPDYSFYAGPQQPLPPLRPAYAASRVTAPTQQKQNQRNTIRVGVMGDEDDSWLFGLDKNGGEGQEGSSRGGENGGNIAGHQFAPMKEASNDE